MAKRLSRYGLNKQLLHKFMIEPQKKLFIVELASLGMRCNMNMFSAFFILSFGVAGLYCITFQIGSQRRKQASFDRFDGTCRGHNVSITFNYYGVRVEGNKLYINSTITAKEDISEEPRLSIRIQRCKNKENLDTCEEFHTYKTEKYCTLIDSDNELWSPFFAAYNPKWKCPIKKGIYQSIDSMLDVSAFLLFPTENYYWKVKGEVFEKNSDRLLMCLFVEARVIAIIDNVDDAKLANSTLILFGQKII